METNTPGRNKNQRLRAIVKIVDGEIVIFPIGESDADTRRILDAVIRSIRERV